MPQHTADQIIKALDRAKTDRINFDSHWQDVADLVLPTRSFTRNLVAGERLRQRVFNATAPNAAMSLASALHGLLMNPAIRWFGLASDDFEDRFDEESEDWLYESSSRMLSYFNHPASGFATSSFETAQDLVSFGTAVVMFRRTRNWLSFQARQISNFYMVENDEGIQIASYREFEMTLDDAVMRFHHFTPGLAPETIALAGKNSDKKITIVHFVFLRDERDPIRRNGRNKPWGSIYVERDRKRIIGESGFEDRIYLTPRWSKAPEEVYGRSPAMMSLPNIRIVNAMTRTQIIAGEQMVRPPMVIPANSTEGPISTAPGSFNYYRAGSRDRPEPMNLGTRVDVGAELIRAVEDKIEEAFFLDRFKLPQGGDGLGQPRMTATEIIDRRQQGLLMASPILSRLYAEWLSPTIQRVFNWMVRTRRFSPRPPQLRNISISYLSPMALSQRASESQGFVAAMNTANSILVIDPTVVDNLDGDEAFRRSFSQWNVDPKYLRRRDEVAAIRANRAQMQEAAEQVELFQGAAAGGKDAAAALKDTSGG